MLVCCGFVDDFFFFVVYSTQKVTHGTICQRPVFVRASSVNLKQAFCCSHHLFSLLSTQSLAERILQQLLPSQPVICCARLLQHSWRRNIENVPARTNDPGGSQLALGIRKAVLDWQHPSLHPHFLPSIASPPNLLWDWQTVGKRH